MIGFLTGKFRTKTDAAAVVDVNGVGYEVCLTKKHLLSLKEPGEPLSLEVYTHVTENSLQLYGFLTAQEKQVFQKLISVSGIGPKLAITLLSHLTVSEFLLALLHGDHAALKSIPGIGQKTAERLVIELKDKFKDHLSASPDMPHTSLHTPSPLADVLGALISLGYSEWHARKAVHSLHVGKEDTIQTLIKKSLIHLKEATPSSS